MLIKEGHRHIGILSGILGKNTMADLRIQGYLEAMEKYDIPCIELHVLAAPDDEIKNIVESIRDMRLMIGMILKILNIHVIVFSTPILTQFSL